MRRIRKVRRVMARLALRVRKARRVLREPTVQALSSTASGQRVLTIAGRVNIRATKLSPDTASDARKLDACRWLCYCNNVLT